LLPEPSWGASNASQCGVMIAPEVYLGVGAVNTSTIKVTGAEEKGNCSVSKLFPWPGWIFIE